MELTQNFIKAKQPCAAGYRWYIRNRHNGTDYQHLLDSLVREGRITDANWLLDNFGPTDTVLEADDIEDDALIFAGMVDLCHQTAMADDEQAVDVGLTTGQVVQDGAKAVGVNTGGSRIGFDLPAVVQLGRRIARWRSDRCMRAHGEAERDTRAG